MQFFHVTLHAVLQKFEIAPCDQLCEVTGEVAKSRKKFYFWDIIHDEPHNCTGGDKVQSSFCDVTCNIA